MAERRLHLPTDGLSTLLLAMAAVATAWSTYQSAQWRGAQASNTAKSTAARIDSSVPARMRCVWARVTAV